MALKVLVLSVAVEPPLFCECSQKKATLGRGPESTIRLPDPTVSSLHATLRKRGSHYLVVDEGSTNGTALITAGSDEPVWLAPDSPRVIEDGDRLLLGRVELAVLTRSEAAGSPSEDLARDLVTTSLATLGHDVTTELVEQALDELTQSDDEPLDRPKPAPAEPTREDDVVTGAEARNLTDLALLGLGLLLLAGSALGLYLLLTDSL